MSNSRISKAVETFATSNNVTAHDLAAILKLDGKLTVSTLKRFVAARSAAATQALRNVIAEPVTAETNQAGAINDHALVVMREALGAQIDAQRQRELANEKSRGVYDSFILAAIECETSYCYSATYQFLSDSIKDNVDGLAVEIGCKTAKKKDKATGKHFYLLPSSFKHAGGALRYCYENNISLGTIDKPRTWPVIAEEVAMHKAAIHEQKMSPEQKTQLAAREKSEAIPSMTSHLAEHSLDDAVVLMQGVKAWMRRHCVKPSPKTEKTDAEQIKLALIVLAKTAAESAAAFKPVLSAATVDKPEKALSEAAEILEVEAAA